MTRGGQIFGGDDLGDVEGEKLGAAVAGCVFHGAIERSEMALAVEREDEVIGVLEQRPIALLRVAQLLFATPAFSDVKDRSVQPVDVSFRREAGPAPLVHPPDLTFRGDDAIVEDEGPLLAQTLVHGVRHRLPVIWMDDACVAASAGTDEVGGGVTGESLDLLADVLHRPLAVGGAPVDDAGDVCDETPESLLARFQRRLGVPTLGDILDQPDHEVRRPVRVTTERGGHPAPELAPVLAHIAFLQPVVLAPTVEELPEELRRLGRVSGCVMRVTDMPRNSSPCS